MTSETESCYGSPYPFDCKDHNGRCYRCPDCTQEFHERRN